MPNPDSRPVYAQVKKRSIKSSTMRKSLNSGGYAMIGPEQERIYNQPQNTVIYSKVFDLQSIGAMLDMIRTEKNVTIGIFTVTEANQPPLDDLDTNVLYEAFNAGTFKTIILFINGSTYRNYSIELTKLKNGLIKESVYYTSTHSRTTKEDILKLYGKPKNNNTGPEYIPLSKQKHNKSLYRRLSSVRGNSGTRKRSGNNTPPPVIGTPPSRKK